jgi:hypothetical protein
VYAIDTPVATPSYYLLFTPCSHTASGLDKAKSNVSFTHGFGVKILIIKTQVAR